MALTDVLQNISGEVQLFSLVEGTLVPIIIGTVKEIKTLVQGQTIEYTVAITTGIDKLTDAEAKFKTALQNINTERAKAGLTPLAIPGQ